MWSTTLENIDRELVKVSEMDTGDAINFTNELLESIIEKINRGTHCHPEQAGNGGCDHRCAQEFKSSFRISNDLRTGVKAYPGSFKSAENRGFDDEDFARVRMEANRMVPSHA